MFLNTVLASSDPEREYMTRQPMYYNEALMRVLVTIVAVEKQ